MKCSRCNVELPKNNTYCVGCGCDNKSAAGAKQVSIDGKLEKRAEKRKLSSLLRRLFRLR